VHLGIVRNRVLSADFGNDLFQQEADVAIAEAVVLEASVRVLAQLTRLILLVTGINEDGYRRRNLARMFKVV
jgi:hypothetical protein